MENVIRAVHVRNCASYISACVCPTSSASDEAQQILFMVSSIFVFQAYSLKIIAYYNNDKINECWPMKLAHCTRT